MTLAAAGLEGARRGVTAPKLVTYGGRLRPDDAPLIERLIREAKPRMAIAAARAG